MKKTRFSLKERSSTKYIRTHVTTPGPTINTDLATRIYISAYPMEFGRIQRRHDFNRTNEPSSRSRLQPSRCKKPPPNRCCTGTDRRPWTHCPVEIASHLLMVPRMAIRFPLDNRATDPACKSRPTTLESMYFRSSQKHGQH